MRYTRKTSIAALIGVVAAAALGTAAEAYSWTAYVKHYPSVQFSGGVPGECQYVYDTFPTQAMSSGTASCERVRVRHYYTAAPYWAGFTSWTEHSTTAYSTVTTRTIQYSEHNADLYR